MGESRASKESRARLEAADKRAEAERSQFLNLAKEKSAPEKAVEESRLGDIDYFNKGDYTTGPKGYIDQTAFQRAALERLRTRTANGGAQAGLYGTNPNLLALSRDAENSRLTEQGAGAYAAQLFDRRQEAFHGAEGLIGTNLQRALTLSGQASQNAQTASTNLANFRPAPSGWAQFGLAALSGASQVAAAFAGKG